MAYTTIDDPSAYFQTMLWTGAGSSYPRDLTYTGNSNLKPDMLWSFGRSNTGSNWILDSSRGFTANKELVADSNLVEGDTNAINSGAYGWPGPGLTNGHQISQAGNYWNVTGNTYMSFGWKGNDGTTTSVTESGNNPGGTHQANTTAGFSIVTYTGTGAAGTVTHGLGAAPKFIMIKNRDVTDSWAVYYGDNTDYLILNSYGASIDNAAWWNDTSPSSTVFTVNTDHAVNADGEAYIAYAFAEKQGFSKFGEYFGNANVNGTFVYTGFKPAFILFKANAAGQSWRVMNAEVSPTNPADAAHVVESNSEIEVTSSTLYCDFLSNGFKHRATGLSNTGTTIIYAAFAEQPLVTSTGVPATAR